MNAANISYQDQFFTVVKSLRNSRPLWPLRASERVLRVRSDHNTDGACSTSLHTYLLSIEPVWTNTALRNWHRAKHGLMTLNYLFIRGSLIAGTRLLLLLQVSSRNKILYKETVFYWFLCILLEDSICTITNL